MTDRRPIFGIRIRRQTVLQVMAQTDTGQFCQGFPTKLVQVTNGQKPR
jgi:hypothetical protein